MVTASKVDVTLRTNTDGEGVAKFELEGKSTDTKPTQRFSGYSIKNGSVFYEMDTGNIFMYDEDENEWLPQ